MAHHLMKLDDNQAEIVAALQQVGATVTSTHMVGDGFPDLVVGFQGVNHLIEVKMPKGRLSKSQVRFRDAWQGGPIWVARTIEQALQILGIIWT